MLAGILARWCGRPRRSHVRAEAMVEYALIAASVAFVAVAGWSVLRDHEVEYFSALPMQPTPPSAPGALLHPTAIEATNCTPNPLQFGQHLVCSVPRVFDTLSNPADRSSPLGTITWFMDGTPIAGGACALTPLAADSSTCAGMLSMSLTLSDPNLADSTHQVWAAYTQPTTNHLPSTGASFSLFIQRWLLVPGFGTNLCANSINGQPDSVEVGHPITCSARLIDLAPELGNSQGLTWEASTAGQGRGVFTCATTGDLSLLWNNACAPATTWTCAPAVTDCTVVYHRLNNVGSPIGAQNDTLHVHGHGLDLIANLRVTVPAAHGSATWATCERTPTGSFQVQARQTKFAATTSKSLTENSVTCTAYVVDVDPNSALDCTQSPLACSPPGTNPDANTAFAPLGNITWTSPALRAPGTCQLTELSLTLVPLAQAQGLAPGQVNSVSSCSVVLGLVGVGNNNEGPGNGQDAVLTVTYNDSSQHNGSTYEFQLRLNQSS